jgi:hypothetical protein
LTKVVQLFLIFAFNFSILILVLSSIGPQVMPTPITTLKLFF